MLGGMSMRGSVSVMIPEKLKLIDVKQETYNTWTLTFTPETEFKFKPGQFCMLYVYGIGEVPISISGDPSDTGKAVFTVRAVGTVTTPMVNLKPGSEVGMRGPFGTSWPVEEAKGKDVLIVAGGIGLAPLRPVIYHVLANRDQYRRFIILYGARTPADLLYVNELDKWFDMNEVELLVTVDKGDESWKPERWKGKEGVVTTLFNHVKLDPENTIAMICGPEIMMYFTVKECQKHGLPDSNIYISMERNMKCGVGMCGHCQFGPFFVCKDGPVFRYDVVKDFFGKKGL